jgi:hypothetical protein
LSVHRVKPTTKNGIAKCPTGIIGVDQITEGGLPKGRPTLVCGTAGCGKTVMAMEFLVRGATQFDEPGVFMAFEETDKDLTQNVASMGFDLSALCAHKKLFLDHVHIDRNENRGDGRVRAGGALRPAGECDRDDWCEARGSGHYRVLVLRIFRHQHSACRTSPLVCVVHQSPILAKDEQIIAAPTLVKRLPLPLRRIIGDFSNRERVLLGLDLKPKK